MIAIGALGGSGTRAISEILIQSGMYMGDDLNKSNDNLIFTRLFKNPDWYRNTSDIEMQKRMSLFKKYMSSNKLSLRDLITLFSASKSNPIFNSEIAFYFRLINKFFSKGKDSTNWGWKEPNTQIYMSELLHFFDELKYIHVVRHGLDMAYSNNKQKLTNGGWKYNIILNGKESKDELAIKQLDYWIESTKNVIEKSKKFNTRFLLTNHTNFCEHPVSEIDKIFKFIGIEVSDRKKQKLYSIPENKGSNDRYMHKDLSIFDNEKMKFIEDMGFEI